MQSLNSAEQVKLEEETDRICVSRPPPPLNLRFVATTTMLKLVYLGSAAPTNSLPINPILFSSSLFKPQGWAPRLLSSSLAPIPRYYLRWSYLLHSQSHRLLFLNPNLIPNSETPLIGDVSVQDHDNSDFWEKKKFNFCFFFFGRKNKYFLDFLIYIYI